MRPSPGVRSHARGSVGAHRGQEHRPKQAGQRDGDGQEQAAGAVIVVVCWMPSGFHCRLARPQRITSDASRLDNLIGSVRASYRWTDGFSPFTNQIRDPLFAVASRPSTSAPLVDDYDVPRESKRAMRAVTDSCPT